ncbi:TetR family transcriptional regulator [Brucella vulpis]|nr:TetR family transcriptional regulator [Brucella vulpis]CUW49229.1 TetR family transcriptional regulator [Brucella vulpis]
MRRTKAEAAETREAILLAAEQVFLERGVNQSTLTEIACYAGVTRGAIYFHFEDKLDIFQSIIGRTRFPQEEIMLQAARFAPSQSAPYSRTIHRRRARACLHSRIPFCMKF